MVHPKELFSRATRHALADATGQYVSKDHDTYDLIEHLKQDQGLDKVLRFDIGKNTDGYSPLIMQTMRQADIAGLARDNFSEYPDNHYHLLRERLGERFGLDPEWFVLSAGLESMIDHIARVFLSIESPYLLPVPNFTLFESYSNRLWAEPILVQLGKQENYYWTMQTTDDLLALIRTRSPRLLWISNPVNPTGQFLHQDYILPLLEMGADRGTMVVVDEAYGEYTDDEHGVVSSSQYLPHFRNLLVLRTFSKMYGIPSARVGFAMCSCPEVRKALNLYRRVFPFSWFSLYVAQIAVLDNSYLNDSRKRMDRRRPRLFKMIDGFEDYEYIPSQTNTLMLRKRGMKAAELWQHLLDRGVLTANISGLSGLIGQEYLRVTIRSNADNDYLVKALKQVKG
jgi:histidinol-phosphate aminotransferase